MEKHEINNHPTDWTSRGCCCFFACLFVFFAGVLFFSRKMCFFFCKEEMINANNSRALLENDSLYKSQWSIDFIRFYELMKLKDPQLLNIVTQPRPSKTS